MKNFLILLILFSLFSCGKKQEKGGGIIAPPTVGFDAQGLATEFRKYQETFEDKMTDLNISDVYAGVPLEDIVAEDIPELNVLGKCTKYFSGGSMVNRKITIDGILWKQLSKADKEELIYHELGHCVLGRNHLNTESGGRETSIMNQYHLGPTKYTTYYSSYMAELFNVTTGTIAAINADNFDGTLYASTLTSEVLASVQFSSDHSGCQHDEVNLDL